MPRAIVSKVMYESLRSVAGRPIGVRVIRLVSKSNRQECDSIDPFVRLRDRPNQNQVVSSLAEWKMLGNDDHARAVLRLHEFGEVSRHGRPIVRDKDATITSRDAENIPILQAGQSC